MEMITAFARREHSVLNDKKLKKKREVGPKVKLIDTIIGNMELVYYFTVPALTSLARKRTIANPVYPVGLKRRGSRGFSNAEFHLSNIQAKAKHEMLANLVLPAFTETSVRERRAACGCHPSTIRNKKDEKRFQVTNEILETEKKYLACLHTLKKVFEDPLREENLLASKEIDIIFPKELAHIRESHTLFMKELEERILNWKQFGVVGDIFTKLSSSYHIDVLKIYSDYVNNFPKAMAIINKCSRGTQKFRRFLQVCSADPDCEGLDLSAYLLTPIQRLPRYVLLLRQLSKCTDPIHPDSFHLENALETMKNMINILNDSIHNSCKIVSNSTSRKSAKRRSLRKRTSLKEIKITKEDNDSSISQGKSSDHCSPTSPTLVMATSPSSPDSPSRGPSSKQENRLSTGSEHSVLTRVRSGDKKSRPVSTGDLDNFYDADHSQEFHAIMEEGEGKGDRSPGQNKFRTAAESMKRSWQRRSKKWRRSFEGKSGSTSTLPEFGRDLGSPNKDNSKERFLFSEKGGSPTISPSLSLEHTENSDCSDFQKVVACNPLFCGENNDDVPSSPFYSPIMSTEDISETRPEVDRTEVERPDESKSFNSNVFTFRKDEELILQSFPGNCSPYSSHRTIRRNHDYQERPTSLTLPTKDCTSEKTDKCNSQSNNNVLISKSAKMASEASEIIWIHRERPRLQKRASSDGLRQSYATRKASVISCDRLSGHSWSRGSIDTSKDSLLGSSVSDTQDNSPINTLNRSNLTENSSSENMAKLKQLSLRERLVYDEVLASGFDGEERKLESDEDLDKLRDGKKSKKKLKEVMKQMFSKKKRRSISSLDSDIVHVHVPSSSKILSRSRSFTKDSKDRLSST